MNVAREHYPYYSRKMTNWRHDLLEALLGGAIAQGCDVIEVISPTILYEGGGYGYVIT